MIEIRLIQLIAKLAPLLAPVPSAFFIGRSIYYHLLHAWHLPLPGWVNLAVAIIAGLSIELLAISSVYLAASLFRWNNFGHVRKEKNPWEHAPFGLALAVSVVYFLVAIYLLVVLEALPTLAKFSAVAFPLLAGVGAVNWALMQGHQDRLDRYGMVWSFKAVKAPEGEPERVKTQVAPKPDPIKVPMAHEPDALDKGIMRAYQTFPDISYSKIADDLGTAKSTVGARVLRLKTAKLLALGSQGRMTVNWRDNGHDAS